VTLDPWPSKITRCLFVKEIPRGINLLKKKIFEKKCDHPCFWLHSHKGPKFANLNVIILYALSFENVKPW
jgi:hypothetical protein